MNNITNGITILFIRYSERDDRYGNTSFFKPKMKT